MPSLSHRESLPKKPLVHYLPSLVSFFPGLALLNAQGSTQTHMCTQAHIQPLPLAQACANRSHSVIHRLCYYGPAHQIQPQGVGIFLDRLSSSYFPLQCNPTGAAQQCGGKNVHARQRTEEKHSKTKQTVMQGKGLTMAATRKHINVALCNSSTLPLVRLQICCLLFLSPNSTKVLHFCSAVCVGWRVRRKIE